MLTLFSPPFVYVNENFYIALTYSIKLIIFENFVFIDTLSPANPVSIILVHLFFHLIHMFIFIYVKFIVNKSLYNSMKNIVNQL